LLPGNEPPFKIESAVSLNRNIKMLHILNSPATLCALIVGYALSLAAQSAEQAPAACEQIVAACTNAGFVRGDYQKGYGLWTDCVNPIVRGTKQPAKADKPLPSVSPELVAACKQASPSFGEGYKGQAKGK
jgi:hypothetical protein